MNSPHLATCPARCVGSVRPLNAGYYRRIVNPAQPMPQCADCGVKMVPLGTDLDGDRGRAVAGA
jgi:hypothetical protein